MKGVNSFSGYVTYMLEEMMQKDKTFARYAPKIEKISIDDDRVVLKDNIKNRIAEVAIQKGELFCQLRVARLGFEHFHEQSVVATEPGADHARDQWFDFGLLSQRIDQQLLLQIQRLVEQQ